MIFVPFFEVSKDFLVKSAKKLTKLSIILSSEVSSAVELTKDGPLLSGKYIYEKDILDIEP